MLVLRALPDKTQLHDSLLQFFERQPRPADVNHAVAVMLDLARHIVIQKSGRFEPDKFEDQYETALIDLINQKRAGKPITPKERPRGENVVDLMEALRRSVGDAAAETAARKKAAKRPRKGSGGQKEMLMPIAGKKPAKKATAKKSACDCGSIDEDGPEGLGRWKQSVLSGRRQADGPDVQWESLRKGIDAYR